MECNYFDILTYVIQLFTFALGYDTCIVTNFDDVSTATSSCKSIILSNFTVPGGQQLRLELLDTAVLTFDGTISFEYGDWIGPLLYITGNRILVQGLPGSVLDGQGHLYWDGAGDVGRTKPRFFHMESCDSVFQKVNLRNCPRQCTAIDNSTNVVLTDWNIDCSEGNPGVAPYGQEGKNTDGFNVHRSKNITVKNSIVQNQDDCVCVNQGSDLEFKNLRCIGSHGLSVAAGVSLSNSSDNVITNVLFHNSSVENCTNGIHVKTVVDGGKGYIDGLMYKDIRIINATSYGIRVQQNYITGGAPNNNINITNLVIENIHGTVSNKAMKVNILCGTGSCFEWSWKNISISGTNKKDNCNYEPFGYDCK